MKSKKALSAVVATVLIIALTLVVGGIIFAVVKNVVNKNLTKSEACYNLYDEINFNNDYTCYNSTGNYTQFSLDRKEISLDSLTVAISWANGGQIYSLTDNSQNIPGLNNYPDNSTGVMLPGNSSGLTYIANGIIETPTKLEISPRRSGNGCGVIDEITNIVEC